MSVTSRPYDFGKNGKGTVFEATVGSDDCEVMSVWVPDPSTRDSIEVSLHFDFLRVEREGLVEMRDLLDAAIKVARLDAHGPLCKCTPCAAAYLDAKDDQ